METSPLFWEVIESRRSIRKFKPDRISAELIEKILSAGVQAPNARHLQSWRFAVCTTPEIISNLADALNENYRCDMLAAGKTPDAVGRLVADRKSRLCAAPLIIVLCVDADDLAVFSFNEPSNNEFLMAVQSTALAGGQMLLGAEALGLGGVWMGSPLFAKQRVVEALNLSSTWLPQGMLLLGYPAEDPVQKERRALDDVVKYIP